MPLTFDCTADHPAPPHLFQAICFSSKCDWAKELATEYVRLRSRPALQPDEKLLEGLGVDTKYLSKCLKKATIPALSVPVPTLHVVRSDFAELTAMMLLEQQEQCTFPYKSIRDRELTHAPGRSIDAIGGKRSPLTLVLNESKLSDEDGKPQVVDKSADSLSKSLTKHMTEHETTANKLWDLTRRIRDKEQLDLFTTLAVFWQEKSWNQFNIICSAFLVRPKTKHSDEDFGDLRKDPTKLHPATVAYRVLCTSDTIEDTIQKFHHEVNGVKADG